MNALSDGMRALLLVVSFTVAGIAYFLYIRIEEFPPDIVRLAPIVWLVGSVFAGVRAVRALRNRSNRVAAGLALALVVPSAVLAAVFSMAALIGD